MFQQQSVTRPQPLLLDQRDQRLVQQPRYVMANPNNQSFSHQPIFTLKQPQQHFSPPRPQLYSSPQAQQHVSPLKVGYTVESELLLEKERNKLLHFQNMDLQQQILQQAETVNLRPNSQMIGYDGNTLQMENEKLSFAYVEKQRELDFVSQKLSIITIELENTIKLYNQRCQEMDKKDVVIGNLEKAKIDWQQQEGRLKIRIAELESQEKGIKQITVSQLKKEENKFQEKVNQLVAENAKINNILSARMKEVQVLNNRVSLMAQENQSLLFRAQNMQVERDKYAATMETLKNDHEQLFQDNEKLSNAYVDMKQRLEEHNGLHVPHFQGGSPISHFQIADNSEQDAELMRLRREVQDYKHKLKMQDINQDNHAFEEVRSLKRTTEDQKFEIESLKRKLQLMSDENDQLRTKPRQADLQYEESRNQINQLKRDHEQIINQLEKRIRDLESQLKNQVQEEEEISNLRRRLHDCEEALRIADNQNQDLMKKLDQMNYNPNERKELQTQINQLKKKSRSMESMEEKYFLLASENDRLHQVIDDLQGQVKIGLSRQTSFDDVLSHQRESVRAQVEREVEFKMSRQFTEDQTYVERLMNRTQELEMRLQTSEEERKSLVQKINSMHHNSSYTTQENNSRLQESLQQYEYENHQLQRELNNMQNENDRLNKMMGERNQFTDNRNDYGRQYRY